MSGTGEAVGLEEGGGPGSSKSHAVHWDGEGEGGAAEGTKRNALGCIL